MTDSAMIAAPGPRLRRILWIDCAACLGSGVLLLLAAGQLSAITGLPRGLLLAAGLMLLPVAAFMAATAVGRLGAGWPAKVIILGNVAWVVASIAVALGIGSLTPTVVGVVLVLAQAAVVLFLAAIEARAR
ncbi:MAG: hypothetical protein KF887_04065 [Paracoccaceae bacterium]|nr:MAG: hypothetical protein KF887_04065 [Paracoccaceae bacterium]